MFLQIVCLVMSSASALSLASNLEKDSIWQIIRDIIVLMGVAIIAREIF